ncbi:MAG: response regulator, partial [Candidatus Omnitrophota bacterium]
KVRTESPNLILLDIKMPGMDGFTFVRRLKADTALEKPPVIILTGFEPMRDLFKLEGVAGYFVKGDDTALLTKSIEAILLSEKIP